MEMYFELSGQDQLGCTQPYPETSVFMTLCMAVIERRYGGHLWGCWTMAVVVLIFNLFNSSV